MSTILYATKIIQVGALVPQFVDQGMLILFGESAPEELHDICALHRPDITLGGIAVGDRLRIDDQVLVIAAVGHLADENLRNLGHVSVKANGLDEAPLPGDVCVADTVRLDVHPGSRVEIVSASEWIGT